MVSNTEKHRGLMRLAGEHPRSEAFNHGLAAVNYARIVPIELTSINQRVNQ